MDLRIFLIKKEFWILTKKWASVQQKKGLKRAKGKLHLHKLY